MPQQTNEHGDWSNAQLRKLGFSRAEIADFSVNINPIGPSPTVQTAVTEHNIHSYPERYAETLTAHLAEFCRVCPDEVLVSNGATELLWSIVRAFAKHGSTLCCVEPTFSEPRLAAQALGITTDSVWQEVDGNLDHKILHSRLTSTSPDLVYICTPNNPTGTHIDRTKLIELIKQSSSVFILDESFLSLSRHHAEAHLPHPENCLRVRSLTKDLGIASLRLGYVLGSRRYIQQLKKLQPPWSVNGVAQAAGLAGLDSWSHVERCRDILLGKGEELATHLRGLGLQPLPSSTIFQLVRIKNVPHVVAECQRAGVLVRDCSSFGLPNYIRLCARQSSDQLRLVQALGATL